MAAISGLVLSRSTMPPKPPRLVPSSEKRPSETALRSAPAQNTGPVWVRMPSHSESSASRRSMASSSPLEMSPLTALRASGRFMVMRATLPSVSKSITGRLPCPLPCHRLAWFRSVVLARLAWFRSVVLARLVWFRSVVLARLVWFRSVVLARLVWSRRSVVLARLVWVSECCSGAAGVVSECCSGAAGVVSSLASGAAGGGGGGRRGPRLGAWGSTPNRDAICGTRSASRWMRESSSSVGLSGAPTGITSVRTGERTTESTTVDHRCWLAVGFRSAAAMVASRSAISGGSGAPALGGWELKRSALTVRPSPMVLASSSSHLRWSTSKRWARPERRLSARALVSSVRAALSAAAITERMSRRSILAIPARAASARSCHSAAFSTGASCSARARTGSDLICGRLWATALAFIRSMDFRTPGTPPLRTSRANGRWSSGRASSAAWRWTRLALIPGVLGLGGLADRFVSLERGDLWERLSPERGSRRSGRCVLRSAPEREPDPLGSSPPPRRERPLVPSSLRGLRSRRSSRRSPPDWSRRFCLPSRRPSPSRPSLRLRPLGRSSPRPPRSSWS